MFVRVPSPKILSPACSEFSVRVDMSAFELATTQRQLGFALPERLQRAVEVRQAEFLVGRFAALSALRAAGFTGETELLSLEDRSVDWPAGFVGSITHTADRDPADGKRSAIFVAAVAAGKPRVRGLGRDTERVMDPKRALEVQSRILTVSEIGNQAASGLDVGAYTTLIFSAKESLYKALAPIVRRYFDFHEAEIDELSLETGRVRLRLLKGLGEGFEQGTIIEARFAIDDYVHTAVELS